MKNEAFMNNLKIIVICENSIEIFFMENAKLKKLNKIGLRDLLIYDWD